MTIENYDKILGWVNSIRAIYSAPALSELVKGVACNGNHCPLANSLVSEAHGVYQVDMAYDHYTLYTSYKLDYKGDLGQVQEFELEDRKFMYTLWGYIPGYIRDFLVQIDNNEHPDLAEPHIFDVEASLDEDYYDYAIDHTQEEVIYEQPFVSKREWFFEEEDEEWEGDYYDDEGWRAIW